MAYNVENNDSWMYLSEPRLGLPEVNWHTQPFFLFNRKFGTNDSRRGFEFVIQGKNMYGVKEAYFLRNEKRLSNRPFRDNSGYFPIEDDAYYMVVAMVEGDTGLNSVQ